MAGAHQNNPDETFGRKYDGPNACRGGDTLEAMYAML